MPSAKSSATQNTPKDAGADVAGVVRFLRGLADRVEHDPAFAGQIAAVLAEAGPEPGGTGEAPAKRAARARMADRATPPEPMDPFAVLRDQGEDALRARLESLATSDLQSVVRAHRLDPARISARWTNRPRLVDLIVAQVRARADHGKAFSRV